MTGELMVTFFVSSEASNESFTANDAREYPIYLQVDTPQNRLGLT